jgi:hypothetical protein
LKKISIVNQDQVAETVEQFEKEGWKPYRIEVLPLGKVKVYGTKE